MPRISNRKNQHLDLATNGKVGFRSKTTLFECVELVHEALPELSLGEIDLSTQVLGKRLRAPLLIAAMTGGSERARAINEDLAAIAEESGYALGLGSQRAQLKDPALRDSYRVRRVAPSALLFGNIGAVQASQLSVPELTDLVGSVEADALCVHLNPAMEVVQPEGDRDFRGILEALERLANEAPFPIIAKETGCGLSGPTGARLRAAGVRHVDVSGSGGTSWVAVETERCAPHERSLGEAFWDWGVPTAASLLQLRPLGFETVIATGGVKAGLDVAKALALGAHCAGIARPTLQALDAGGRSGATQYLASVEEELRVALLLTGCPSVAAARQAPHYLHSALARWGQEPH